MSEPNEEPTEKPTRTEEEATQEGAWMLRNWLGIAVVSIAALVVIALGLLQWTGLIDVFGPVASTETGQWMAFGVLVLVVVALAAWTWKPFV